VENYVNRNVNKEIYMKLRCKREDLVKTLSVATRLVKTRANLPILSNVMLSTDRNKVKISATDLESSVAIYI
jgi:DNA polymerase-3 subunit beta